MYVDLYREVILRLCGYRLVVPEQRLFLPLPSHTLLGWSALLSQLGVEAIVLQLYYGYILWGGRAHSGLHIDNTRQWVLQRRGCPNGRTDQRKPCVIQQ